MRNLWGLALALSLAACGGSSKTSTAAQPEVKASPCAAMADHAVKVALAQQQPAPPADTLAEVTRVVTARCDDDKWSADAQGCMSKAANHEDALKCMEMLTETQRKAVEHDVGAVMEKSGAHDGPANQPAMAPTAPASSAVPSTGAAPPAPPSPARSKGADKNKKTSDPCDGGQ